VELWIWAWRIVSVRTSVKCLSTLEGRRLETCWPMTMQHGRAGIAETPGLSACPPLYVLTRFKTASHGKNININTTLVLRFRCMRHSMDYSFPRLRNLFGSSTCLDLMNSATFLPKKSYELEQLTPRSR
jgi:hypothetical protein